MTLRLLDLFCGAGGASMGYHRAGFEVVGIDIEPHPSYPFGFILGDALTALTAEQIAEDFDAVAASPPCQVFTRARHLRDAQGKGTASVDLVEPTRDLLRATGLPYVIENVPGAPLVDPIQLCGSSFGLGVRRHRMFESTVPVMALPCDHRAQGRPVGLYGSMRDDIPRGGRTAHSIEEAREAIGIDWMRWRSANQEWNDLKESIPPAYTEHVGGFLVAAIKAVAA